MSAQSLSITYSPDPATIDQEEYYINLEQVEMEPDTITVAEAAAVIDAAFALDPCEDDSALTGGEEQSIDSEGNLEMPTTEDEFEQAVAEELDFNICALADDGSYEAQIKVYRSHQSEQYVLRLTNGEILSTVTETVEVDEQLQVDGTSITPTIPITGTVTSSATISSVKGSTINFTETINDRVQLSYMGQYDLVTIKVYGDPDQPEEPGECTAIGFFHGLAAEIDMESPPVDEEMSVLEQEAYCSAASGGTIDMDADSVSCYKIRHQVTKCRCSGTEMDRNTIEVSVDCPEGDLYCPGGETSCRKLIGSETVTVGYTQCTGEEGQDACSDPEYVTDACCGYPKVIPPCCTVTGVYSGGKGIAGGADKYKALYGDNVRLVAVSPSDGICGKHITNYVADANCCEDAEPLELAADVEDIYLGTCVDIWVKGDIGVLEWSVGGGYTLHYDQTGTPGHNILCADSEAVCGDAAVQIKGECGSLIVNVTLGSVLEPFIFDNCDPDFVVSPDTNVGFSTSYGVPPFNWSAGTLELVSEVDGNATFYVPEDFCDTDTVTVTDACGNTVECFVRSTDGHWEPLGEGEWDECTCPAGNGAGEILSYFSFSDVPASWQRINDEYQCIIKQAYIGTGTFELEREDSPCGVLWDTPINIACQISDAMNPGATITTSGNCCVYTSDNPDAPQMYLCYMQWVDSASKWEC